MAQTSPPASKVTGSGVASMLNMDAVNLCSLGRLILSVVLQKSVVCSMGGVLNQLLNKGP